MTDNQNKTSRCSFNGCPFWDFENEKCIYQTCKLKD